MNSYLSNNIICGMHFIPCAVYVQMSSCLTFFLSCVAVSCSLSLWVSQYIIYTYLTSQELHCFFFILCHAQSSVDDYNHSTIFNLCYSKRRDILERRASEIFFIEKCFLNLANSSRNQRLLVLSFRESRRIQKRLLSLLRQQSWNLLWHGFCYLMLSPVHA